jgi:hypothetical protein
MLFPKELLTANSYGAKLLPCEGWSWHNGEETSQEAAGGCKNQLSAFADLSVRREARTLSVLGASSKLETKSDTGG